jgi:hypothetical protein
MSLNVWLANGWMRPHQTDAAEIRADATELIQFSYDLRQEVLGWLKATHPNFVPE